MIISKHSYQNKLFLLLNEFSQRGKWQELCLTLKLLNKILTRNYIDIYWKYLFKYVVHCKSASIETKIPNFIDCLSRMNLETVSESIYSIIYLCLTRNQFKMAYDLIQMYHLTSSGSRDVHLNRLVNVLNSEFDYIKWKESIQHDSESNKNDNRFAKQIAEKCTYLLLNLIDQMPDVADFQIKKLTQIYVYYNKLNEIKEILVDYISKNPHYINSYKYLFEFKLKFLNEFDMQLLNKIGEFDPLDSLILHNINNYVDDQIMLIDCLFEMLDGHQWKYDKSCWKHFNKCLLKSKRTETIRECIRDNWMLRKSYWLPYHFSSINLNYQKIDAYRLSCGVILLGPEHTLMNKLAKSYFLQISHFRKEIEIYNWLNENIV